ncbi:MAG: DNA-processing protein DprA [Clostridia bacterium]|nr:DNA-processing protein DprA [Clostridia bacterium]
MTYSESERYWIWLSQLKGMTPRRFYKILAEAGDAENVYRNPFEFKGLFDDKTFEGLKSSISNGEIDTLFEGMEKNGVSAITRLSDLYPERLSHISDPPATLFVKGSTALDADKPFAVVGTRRVSYDGKKAAQEFTRVLGENGVTVISGLARGVDTLAHTSCLDVSGRTIAVLGNGLDSVYPPENEKLAQRIIDCGGSVISELRPDESPARWTFPARNRIIAGLSEGVLVVEGDKKSGSLITAQLALEEGRDVFAIPGSIYNFMAEGPNSLIQNGAYMALSPWDILEAMRWGTRPGGEEKQVKAPELDENEKKIYDLLKNGALSFDELENLTQFSTSSLNSCLTMLVLRSIIIKLPGNLYRLA